MISLLSSPLQWPLLVIGIAGLALQVRVALLAQREEDLTQERRGCLRGHGGLSGGRSSR